MRKLRGAAGCIGRFLNYKSGVELFTEEEVEDRWSRASCLSDEKQALAWSEFHKQQPALFYYVNQRAESRFEPELSELLTTTAGLLWIVFDEAATESGDTISPVDIGLLARLEEANGAILEHLSEEEALRTDFEERFDNLAYHIEESLQQEHLYRLAFERLDDAHADRNPELDDFNFALLLFFLKVLVDALDGEF